MEGRLLYLRRREMELVLLQMKTNPKIRNKPSSTRRVADTNRNKAISNGSPNRNLRRTVRIQKREEMPLPKSSRSPMRRRRKLSPKKQLITKKNQLKKRRKRRVMRTMTERIC
jgi:hypothetical protein